ncbi:hypothetical protein CRG98_000637 [Punica granatum]|uniref:Uncharacterized protein n=1 Tax=Punica granatum TaxID=22663 RepID=A0A2I0LFK2_PUNGR|nr:hypothetical protein CRG98_000637 [Punica granatum]
MNCLDSNAGEPTKAVASKEEDALIGTVLSKDGGSRFNGANSLKSGGIFRGCVIGPAEHHTLTRNPYLTYASYYRSWDTTHRYLKLV